MARKPKMKKFTPPKKVSEENLAIREAVEAYKPERLKVHNQFYKEAAEHRKYLESIGLR